jgi:uncharacterized membrane protein YfcA
LVTTIAAPLGSLFVQRIDASYVWYVYIVAVVFLAWRLWHPVTSRENGQEHFTLALILAFPIALLSGLLGVGPGFLLMPTLIMLGFETKRAAGINALAVTPPSFSALIPHLATARLDPSVAIPLIVAGAIGSFLGARYSSRLLSGARIKQVFGGLIVVMTLVRVSTLYR